MITGLVAEVYLAHERLLLAEPHTWGMSAHQQSHLPQLTTDAVPVVPKQEYTRKDLARLFRRSTKTIQRWEAAGHLVGTRSNARVLHYQLYVVQKLVTSGVDCDPVVAREFGLSPSTIERANQIAQPCTAGRCESSVPGVLIAKTDADRRLIIAWEDPRYHLFLERVVQGIFLLPDGLAPHA